MLPTGLDNALMRVDIISWIDLALGFLKHGRLHRFEWIDGPAPLGIYADLRRLRIHPYGPGLHIEERTDGDGTQRRSYRRWFYVNRKQANFAEYVLMATCVPLEGALLNPNNAKAWGKGAPRRAWQDGKATATPVEVIADWFESLCR